MAELYRNSFYLSPGICCLFKGSTYQLHDVNANFEKHLRVSHDEAVIDKICSFIARKDDRDYFESIVKQLEYRKIEHLDEIELIADEGGSAFVRCSLTLLDSDIISFRGDIVKVSSSDAVSRDASRKSSLTLDSSFLVPFMPFDPQELYSLFHRIPVGFQCVSVTGVILYANETLLNILGYAANEYVGKPITNFVEADELWPMVNRIKAGELVHNYPYILRAKDGSRKTCLADSDMQRNADGALAHSRTFLRYDVDRIVDQAISNDRIAKLAMIAAEKDRFIRIIFHEIRTPLHNLSTRINNTLRQSNIPQVFVDEMRFQIDACTGLVEDLSFATMFESDQVLHPRPVHMRIRKELETITQYINMFHEAELHKKMIKIHKIVDVHIPDVIAVDKSILRVLHNLIHNAVKFCCNGGTVLINLAFVDEAREGESNLVFTVTNSVSKPMDLVHINKLFQSCYHNSADVNLTEDLSNSNSFYTYSATEEVPSIHSLDSSLLRRSDSPFSPSALRKLDSPLPKVKGPGTNNPIARLKLNSSPTGSGSGGSRTDSPRRTESPVQRLRHEISRTRADSATGSPLAASSGTSGSTGAAVGTPTGSGGSGGGVVSGGTASMAELSQKVNLHVDITGTPPQFLSVSNDDAKKYETLSSSLTSNEGLGLGLFVSYNIVQSLGGLLEVAGNDRESCFTFSLHVDTVSSLKTTTPVAATPGKVMSVFGAKGAAWSKLSNSSVKNKHIVDVVIPDPPPMTPEFSRSSSSSSAQPTPTHRLSNISGSTGGVSVGGPLKVSPRAVPPIEMSRSDSGGVTLPHINAPSVGQLTAISGSSGSNSGSNLSPATRRALPRLARILIVDDSPICRKVLVRSLESAGYATDVACDGQEACDKLSPAPSHFDLVLMDLRMPIMDGITATKICKAQPHLVNLPIVIVTAEMGEDVREAAMSAKASHFISKPAVVTELLEVMQTLIKW